MDECHCVCRVGDGLDVFLDDMVESDDESVSHLICNLLDLVLGIGVSAEVEEESVSHFIFNLLEHFLVIGADVDVSVS